MRKKDVVRFINDNYADVMHVLEANWHYRWRKRMLDSAVYILIGLMWLAALSVCGAVALSLDKLWHRL